MTSQEMNILFDNPWATYYVGGTVAGQLMLNLDAPKKLRGQEFEVLKFYFLFALIT